MKEKDIQDHYVSIYSGFSPHTQYIFEADQLTINKGDVDCVMMKLYDKETGNTIASRAFDIKVSDKNGIKWYFTTPETDCSEVSLLLYCGVDGETEGNSICYEGVTLYKGWNLDKTEIGSW